MNHCKIIMNKEELRRANVAIRKKMSTFVTAAFGLVAALAWNEAIKSLIDTFVPEAGNSVFAKLAYAIGITVLVGVVLYVIERSSEEEKDKEKDKEKKS